MNMKFKLLVWTNQYRGLYISVFDFLLRNLTFCGPLKNFWFLKQFGNWWHNKGKCFYNAHVKLCHPINLDLLGGVVGIGIFIKVSTFLGSITFPYLDSMKPRMVLENTMNAHLFGFRLIPNSLHFKKHFLNFSRCVDR